MDESEKTARAMKQVEAITGFYIHVVIYVLVIGLLFVINWFTRADGWWVQWPALGWGVGVLAHAILAFGSMPDFIGQWQRRKVKELRDKM